MIETVIHLPYGYQINENETHRLLVIHELNPKGEMTGKSYTIWFDRITATKIGKSLLGFSETDDATNGEEKSAIILEPKGKKSAKS